MVNLIDSQLIRLFRRRFYVSLLTVKAYALIGQGRQGVCAYLRDYEAPGPLSSLAESRRGQSHGVTLRLCLHGVGGPDGADGASRSPVRANGTNADAYASGRGCAPMSCCKLRKS